MAPSDYKSYGSYTPIYREARRALYDHLYADQAHQVDIVLDAIAEHCSPVGSCFPGIKRLMEISRYGEGTVRRAVEELSRLDYIREHEEISAARQTRLVTWQISPWVLWISKDNIDIAEQLWQAGKPVSLYRNEMCKEQPTPESSTRIQHQEPAPLTNTRTTTTTYSSNSQKTEKPEPRTRGKATAARSAKKQDVSPESAQSAEIQGESPTQQREAPKQHQKSVPPPVPLSLCKDPLDGYAENVAQRVATDLNTRLSQARQLVKQYDVQNVEAGLRWMVAETAKGKVERPFGLLKWWLMSNVIDPQDVPVDRVPSINGKYSEFFER
jgi:hypothetical protein